MENLSQSINMIKLDLHKLNAKLFLQIFVVDFNLWETVPSCTILSILGASPKN